MDPPRQNPIKVTRKGEAPVLWATDLGGRGTLVAGTGTTDVVELWEWTLGPGDEHRSDPHAPGTKELVQVQTGRITILAGGESVSLAKGDGAVFAADVPHAYANADARPARFTLAVFEPEVGSTSGTEHTDV